VKNKEASLGIGVIYFSKPQGRLHADALDTYNWLLTEDKLMAKKFKDKATKADDLLNKHFECGYSLGNNNWGKKAIDDTKNKIKDKNKKWWQL